MSPTRWLAPAALSLAAVVAGRWFLATGAQRPPEPPRPTTATSIDPHARAELTAVEGQIGALRVELAALKAAPTSGPAQPTAVESADALLAAPPPATPTTPEELRASLDLAFQSQVIDVAWARAEERAITDFVSLEAPSGKLESLECRSDLCKMTLKFDSESSLAGFRVKLGAPPLDNGGFYQIEETRFTYFTPRKGHTLPLEGKE